MNIRQYVQYSLILASAILLSGCHATSSQPQKKPIQTASRATRYVSMPVIQWHPVSVGPEVLLDEGTAISSVLAGPDGRIYYGTSNPLGDSTVIGWYNPQSGKNLWRTVPWTPYFPSHSGLTASNLSLSQSAYWGAVDLIVSGAHTVWYRHWGYVGGWTNENRFVPGDYAIPGPTVHRNPYTASVYTSFQGTQLVRIMNVNTKQMQSYPLPSNATPVAIAFGHSSQHVWLLSANTLWELNTQDNQWTPEAQAPTGDFFVSMGQFRSGLWIVDANGNIGLIQHQQIQWIAHLSLSPIAAETAGHDGLWLASVHHLTLWLPHHAIKQWSWPKLSYPAPASTWSQHGSNTPPDWPPIPHITMGPHHVLEIGYGTDIGQAYFRAETPRSLAQSTSQPTSP
ncbi:hypothetical protein [Sulfobacillus thermosulfidooxidans]|uniref:hypothetical protein n=1 Tax=Sulfobacillus thermosulfidooxidans TaxID=28034 RepID=UPI00096B7AD4|nr:hypothetical protein [Sulfobacillus thermosulfidooxidans]OLZ10986.1 hypothetical protein BFX05_09645 [Sulfobacillus thermosulfidooxidans]OLZ14474.1 hypothetical protein BFX06_09470 [Sulfobacillus thermosulfidooxidans]OLZ19217.1 hypothetical protein BFX07_05865 [Sulfobacillus thermosulfidooxidans]